MDIIYHWHSFVEIEDNWNSILIDPFIIGNPLCDIKLEDIIKKNITHICITHGHSDHIWDTVEIFKKTWCKIISTFEVIKYFEKYYNITNNWSMHIWWKKTFESFSIKYVNAVHGWSIGPEFFPGKAAWLIISINWKNIYHAWDTALTYDMKLLKDENIDLAFLPIWWNFTMEIDDAVKAVKFINPKIVVPIHYDTFDSIKANPMIFAQEIMLNNLSNCKVLNPWQSIVY